ncbi:WG repeat-containing protein [Fulvivirgaceae bacterium PWU5]|uniref:WG repeat-containing protein n=1 Tax=Dawidia cretensis TaxID=2782350 RepID=A0AAP2GSE7_9BACT|nr:WG repeat-containing protein [Dawidia cretensis]MBT1711194.1 WG repeat-containing protein [Dawidia cretensis]
MKKWFFVVLIVQVLSQASGQNLFVAKAKKKAYGFIDPAGNWVVSATFEDAEAFSNGYARVKKAGHWSYIDKDAKLVTGFRFDKVYNFDGEVARVGIADEQDRLSYGLIDVTGQWVKKNEFDEIGEFSDNGLALAQAHNGDWGFIDKKGQWVIQPTFGGLHEFHGGLAMARSKGKWGYIDKTGTWVIPAIYNHATSFQEGIASIRTNGGRWILIDMQGKPVGSLVFDVVKPFSDSVTVARVSGAWGVVDRHGRWLVKPKFDYLGSFVDGLCRTRLKRFYWGTIDKAGKWVIQPDFENVLQFSEGICRIKKGTLWGYMEHTGNWIVEPKFQSAGKFHNGYAIVKINGNWGIIDKTGKFTLEPTFDKIRPQADDDETAEGEEAEMNDE